MRSRGGRSDRGDAGLSPLRGPHPLTASLHSQDQPRARAAGRAGVSPPQGPGPRRVSPSAPPAAPPSGPHARSPAALPRASRPGGRGVPGSGRRARCRRRTRAAARSRRTTGEPGRAPGRAAPAPAPGPGPPRTWPSERPRPGSTCRRWLLGGASLTPPPGPNGRPPPRPAPARALGGSWPGPRTLRRSFFLFPNQVALYACLSYS